MSHSSEATHQHLDFPRPGLEADPSAPDFDVRTASSSQLVMSAHALADAIRAANILDPMVPDLVRREAHIREELSRRDVLLMQGSLWTSNEPTDESSRSARQALVHRVRTRNGRGGPGGPGDWDD
jgi:hypothetical protein